MKPLRAKVEATSARPATPPDERPRLEVRHLTVGEQSEGQRLDNFLQGRLRGLPKSLIHRIIRTGQVRVNGPRPGSTPSSRLTGGTRMSSPSPIL